MTITAVLYSHDSIGLGHARRNRALAFALAERLPALLGEDVGGLLIAGHPDASADTLPPGWDWLVLPGFLRTPEGYASRRLPLSVEELAELRGATITSAVEALEPDLLIADRHPFGVGGELAGALASLRSRGRCATVLGLRDVLDAPQAVRPEWEGGGGVEAVADAYDAVWVYGDRGIYDPLATGEVPASLAPRVRTTGYLSHGRPEASAAVAGSPFVLTMVGGGADGGPVARAAAAAEVPRGLRHLVITGPQMPEAAAAEVRRAATGDTVVLRTAANVPALIRAASAVVTMGGYNSLTEVMATDTPALVVPRCSRRAEQSRRAAALADAGAVDVLAAGECTPAALGSWLAETAGRRTDRGGIDLDGLVRVPELAAELVRSRRRAAAPAVHTAAAAGRSRLAEAAHAH
ncbi:glycosyltransferase family protein [Brevibacterium album]|uniref:glycosyltransferase family protein n=1 Tax=Brevibacterium album TaxID=417948 RepID=UPI0003F77901|nr:glycosyltransferase [Brevibacterium album]